MRFIFDTLPDAGLILIHPPLPKSPAPSPCEARAGRGLGRGARSIKLWRSFEIPSPPSPSWGEGIDRGLGGGIKMRPQTRCPRRATRTEARQSVNSRYPTFPKDELKTTRDWANRIRASSPSPLTRRRGSGLRRAEVVSATQAGRGGRLEPLSPAPLRLSARSCLAGREGRPPGNGSSS